MVLRRQALLAWTTPGYKFAARDKGARKDGAFEDSGVRRIVMNPGRQQKTESRTG